MSDTVKLVIEIDERLYERIKYYEPNGNIMAATALHSIANGTPLFEVLDEIETDGEIVSGSIAKIKIQNIIDKHIAKSEKGGE